jgi:hypothetical protein
MLFDLVCSRVSSCCPCRQDNEDEVTPMKSFEPPLSERLKEYVTPQNGLMGASVVGFVTNGFYTAAAAATEFIPLNGTIFNAQNFGFYSIPTLLTGVVTVASSVVFVGVVMGKYMGNEDVPEVYTSLSEETPLGEFEDRRSYTVVPNGLDYDGSSSDESIEFPLVETRPPQTEKSKKLQQRRNTVNKDSPYKAQQQ